MISHLKDEKDFEKATKTKCLVDFYAEWCGPCKMMGALLEDMGDKVTLPVIKVNTDECPNIAQSMGVMSIPTLVIMENGKELSRHIGFMSEDELLEFMK